MTVPTAASGSDKFPTGSWSYGPLNVQWNIKNNDEVDVDVSVLGIDVDELSGTLTADKSSVSNQLAVLGIVKGSLGLTANYNQGPDIDGMWITGQVTAGPWDSGVLNHRIIPW